MAQQELLIRVVRVLDACGIEYMATGSIASSLYGEPRSTHDIDLVVALGEQQAMELPQHFPPPDFYVSVDAIRDAVRRRRMFNLLSTRDGEKVDFWLLTDEAFDQSRFSRRVAIDVFGLRLRVSTAEDTILAKLAWSRRAGGSERQYADALRVYEIQHVVLDEAYLDLWAGRLGVESLLTRLRSEAEIA